MRRFTPALILTVLAAALFLNFWPSLRLPGLGADSESRLVETKLGLDLVGGLQVEYQALPAGGKSPDAGAMATIKQIVENRVNSQGVTEPVVQTQGSDRIVVELPGVNDPDPIRKLLGSTGRLDFVPLPPERYGTGSAPGPSQAVDGQPLPTRGDRALRRRPRSTRRSRARTATDGRAVGFRLKDDGRQALRRLHAARTSATSSRSCSTGWWSPPRSSRARSPAATGIITGGSDGFSVDRDEQPRHGPGLRLAAVPDPGGRAPGHRRDAGGLLARPDPARRPDRDPPGLPLHARLLPAARRRRLPRRSSTTPWSCWRSSG